MKNNKSYFPFHSLLKDNLPQFILNNKEAKYSGIVKNSEHSFFLIGMDGEIVESNHAATNMFGYSPAEFKSLKRWSIIDHNNPDLISAIQHAEKNGFAITEATGMKKNGECFPIEMTSTFFKDHKGVNTCCMVSDLSTHKKTEAAMRLSNERYDLVIKATKDLVWDWDLVTGEIYRNDSRLYDVYGLRCNETIKNIHDWSGFIHPLDKEKILALIDHYINSAEENDFVFEYRFRKEDGTYAYILDKGYIIRNAEGIAIRMIGAAQNITERKKTELAIEESEQRYKNFLELSTEGIWRIEIREPFDINAPLEELIDQCFSSAYIAECNDAYAQMYGFREAVELIGIPLNKLWPIENKVTVKYITGFIKNGFKATEEISHEYNRNCEPVIFINNMLGIVEGDLLIRIWGTRRNITDQVRTEKALAESEEHVRIMTQSNHQQITEAVIAGQEKERTEIGEELHDNINQILASTKLYIECSLKDTTPRTDLIIESKQLLEKAMKEIRKLSKSLLPPSLGEIGLCQALYELVENLMQVNALAISIEWNDTEENEISAKLKLTIFRMVQEQLTNVIKHANAENIIISIKKEDGQIQLCVKDDGEGFDTSLKRVGVGLRNISSRAEVNNGKVCIISAPGEGCELIVTFDEISTADYFNEE